MEEFAVSTADLNRAFSRMLTADLSRLQGGPSKRGLARRIRASLGLALSAGSEKDLVDNWLSGQLPSGSRGPFSRKTILTTVHAVLNDLFIEARDRNPEIGEPCDYVNAFLHVAIPETPAADINEREKPATPSDDDELQPQGRSFGIPRFPPHFVPTPEAVEKIQVELGIPSPNGNRASHGFNTVVVWGMGGVGKSVLATAVVRDPQTLQQFTDGTIWIGFDGDGDDTTLISGLRSLAQATSGRTIQVADPNTARQELAAALADKNHLIVLDNVSSVQHAKIFEALVGDRCRLLLTTRDGTIATALGAREYLAIPLTDDQSAQLVASWMADDSKGSESHSAAYEMPELAHEVLHHCGSLPLAIALVCAAVREGVSWRSILTALELSELPYLDHPHGSVFKCIDVSVRTLPAELSKLYISLSVFYPSATLPFDAVATYWNARYQLPRHQAERSLAQLHRKSLLSVIRTPDNQEIRLHDLHHDYLNHIAPAISGDHARLLDAYGAVFPAGWHPIEHGGYLLPRLFFHLQRAGHTEDMRRLALDPRFVAAKIKASSSVDLRKDMATAEHNFPDDSLMAAFSAALPSIGHLLDAGKTEQDILHTLRSRLSSFEPIWAHTTLGLHLEPLQAMPDSNHPAMKHAFRGHRGSVQCCTVLQGRRQIVSGSRDRTIQVWDLHTSRLVSSKLDTLIADYAGCEELSDGNYVASAYCHGETTITLWDGVNHQQIKMVAQHPGRPMSLAVHEKTGILASGSGTGELFLYPMDDQSVATSSKDGHTGAIFDLAFNRIGNRLVSASADGSLIVWDVPACQPVGRLTGHDREVTGCVFSRDERYIFSVSYDGSIRQWDVITYQEVNCYSGTGGAFFKCRLNPDGQSLAVGGERQIELWNIGTGTLVDVLVGHTDLVVDLAFDTMTHNLLSASYDPTPGS